MRVVIEAIVLLLLASSNLYQENELNLLMDQLVLRASSYGIVKTCKTGDNLGQVQQAKKLRKSPR